MIHCSSQIPPLSTCLDSFHLKKSWKVFGRIFTSLENIKTYHRPTAHLIWHSYGSGFTSARLAIAILKPVVARSKLQDREGIRSRKVARKPRGGDGAAEPVRIVFNTSFRWISSWYTLWLVNNCHSLLQHLCQSFGFARTESNKHVEHVNRNPPVPRTFWRFDIWHFDRRNGFSVSGRGSERIEVF